MPAASLLLVFVTEALAVDIIMDNRDASFVGAAPRPYRGRLQGNRAPNNAGD